MILLFNGGEYSKISGFAESKEQSKKEVLKSQQCDRNRGLTIEIFYQAL